MKTISSLLLAGAAVGAAATANAQITSTNDLILFVTDTSNNQAFVQDLGTLTSNVGSTAGGSYSISSGAIGTISNPSIASGILNASGIDTSLASFLTTNSGGNFVYGILGFSGNGGAGPGQSTGVQTLDASSAQVLAEVAAGTSNFNATNLYESEPSSSNAVTLVQGIGSFLTAVQSGTNTTPYGASTGTGAQGASTLGTPNDYKLGSTVYLWAIASNGAGVDANFYASNTAIVVGTNGSITGLSSGGTTVPLPAAIWLLGSGLVGLAGISRRRSAA
jgi:hypothetical protein